MVKRADRAIERERAIYKDDVVTVINRGKLKSTVRTARGYVLDDVPTRELDFKNVPEGQELLKFETPTS